MREGQLGTLRPGQVCAAWALRAPQAEASAPASPCMTASVPEAHSCLSPAQAAERDARKAGSGLPGLAPRLQEVPASGLSEETCHAPDLHSFDKCYLLTA